MRQFAVYAAAIVMSAAMFASAPAKAEMNPGPVKKGTQCWVGARGIADMGFGHWAACPQPASTAAQPRRTPRQRS